MKSEHVVFFTIATSTGKESGSVLAKSRFLVDELNPAPVEML